MSSRVVVAHVTPLYRSIEGEVSAASMAMAFRWKDLTPPGWFYKYKSYTGSPVMHSRNCLVEWALEDQLAGAAPDEVHRADDKGPPADIILWQDSDCPESYGAMIEMVKLLERSPPEVGAIAAPCVQSTPEGDPVLNLNFVEHQASLPAFERGACVECSAAGFGLIATRASVYPAIGFPWFEWKYAGTNTKSAIGEDMGWCTRARLAGYSIYAHGGMATGHVFPREYRRTEDARKWLDLSKPPTPPTPPEQPEMLKTSHILTTSP